MTLLLTYNIDDIQQQARERRLSYVLTYHEGLLLLRKRISR